MTKFTNRIKPDSTELERYFLSVYTGNLWDALDKIKDWHSPEHIEKEVQMKLLKIQQQALPVVPECVGNFLKGKSIFGIANGDIPDDVISWVQGKTCYVDLEKIISHLISIKIIGYTVEKPQLFRVCLLDGRHTLTRRDPRKTLPFNYTFLWSYSSELKEMREINKEVDLFTEQEIKSIDERYWQFAVPVEDGE